MKNMWRNCLIGFDRQQVQANISQHNLGWLNMVANRSNVQRMLLVNSLVFRLGLDDTWSSLSVQQLPHKCIDAVSFHVQMWIFFRHGFTHFRLAPWQWRSVKFSFTWNGQNKAATSLFHLVVRSLHLRKACLFQEMDRNLQESLCTTWYEVHT